MKAMAKLPTAAKIQPACARVFGLLRSPVSWILAWGVYSLLALGYFGYQSAWLNTVCLAR